MYLTKVVSSVTVIWLSLAVCTTSQAQTMDDDDSDGTEGEVVVAGGGGRNMLFTNPRAAFVIQGKTGTYDYLNRDNTRKYGRLSYDRTINLRLDNGGRVKIDVYRLGNTRMWVGLSYNTFKLDNNPKKLRYRLYYTYDLKRFTRWSTEGGTRGVELAANAMDVEEDDN